METHEKGKRTSERIHKCDSCLKLFFDTRTLKKHVSRVHGTKDFKCDSCGKLFSRGKQMREHFLAVHENVKKNCNICGKSVKDLICHNRTHHEDRKKCDICGKSVSHLRSHIRDQHEGTKCDSCNKSFTQLCNLKTHLKTCKVHEKDNLPSKQNGLVINEFEIICQNSRLFIKDTRISNIK